MGVNATDLSVDDLRALISNCVRETLEDAIEDLAALSSPKYLKSIEEARRDIREGRVTLLENLNLKDEEEDG